MIQLGNNKFGLMIQPGKDFDLTPGCSHQK
jgi:hypothetical protein